MVTKAEVEKRVLTVPLVEVRLVKVAEPLVRVVMSPLPYRSEVPDAVAIPAEVAVSVETVPLVEVRLVKVADPLVNVVTLPLP